MVYGNCLIVSDRSDQFRWRVKFLKTDNEFIFSIGTFRDFENKKFHLYATLVSPTILYLLIFKKSYNTSVFMPHRRGTH